jgi:hypothetical protein
MGLSIKEKLEAKMRERDAQNGSGSGSNNAPEVRVNDSETLKTTSKSGA